MVICNDTEAEGNQKSNPVLFTEKTVDQSASETTCHKVSLWLCVSQQRSTLKKTSPNCLQAAKTRRQGGRCWSGVLLRKTDPQPSRKEQPAQWAKVLNSRGLICFKRPGEEPALFAKWDLRYEQARMVFFLPIRSADSTE